MTKNIFFYWKKLKDNSKFRFLKWFSPWFLYMISAWSLFKRHKWNKSGLDFTHVINCVKFKSVQILHLVFREVLALKFVYFRHLCLFLREHVPAFLPLTCMLLLTGALNTALILRAEQVTLGRTSCGFCSCVFFTWKFEKHQLCWAVKVKVKRIKQSFAHGQFIFSKLGGFRWRAFGCRTTECALWGWWSSHMITC